MKVSGYASTPHMDLVRDVVAQGAFAETLKKKQLGGPKGIKLFYGHDKNKIIGHIMKLEENEKGLFIEASIEEDHTQMAKEAAGMIRSNRGLSFSIGYRLIDADIGRDNEGEYLILKKIDLSEVSVVVSPANPEAIITEYDY